MTAEATGRLGRLHSTDAVVFERRFGASVEDVWASVTEPERLARWIGTWTGDPTTGAVTFTFNAEGEGAPASTFEIRRCDPPHTLRVLATDDFGSWDLTVDVRRDGAETVLSLTQVLHDPSALENTGPGWDYYLDRLVLAEAGGDPSTLDWDRDYYPRLAGHYADLAGQLPAR